MQRTTRHESGRQKMVYVLMVPTMAMILAGAVFSVALPTIRDQYGLTVDMAAWLVTAYSLPFMMLMPLYGRLSDSLGKRNLILFGLGFFCIGTVITMVAQPLPLLLFGRLVQGAGVAGIAPLSMAIISERFSRSERGKALGTWNSVGPMMGIVGPLSAGVMIDLIGWRSIFLPVLLLALLAFGAVWLFIPSLRTVRFGMLRNFDWLGVLLMGMSVTLLVFYISSRPITGVDPLHDWRLLVMCIAAGVLFIVRERRRQDPFISLDLFRIPSLRWASVGAGLRMFTMGSFSFLGPLYLADVRSLSAGLIGVVIACHAFSLLTTMRFGGQLADRWGSNLPVTVGMSVQAMSLAYFALLPDTVPLTLVVGGLMVHGAGAGLSLAALHRASMSDVAPEHSGQSAGIYSMIRFGGVLMGAALGGVLLQEAQASAPTMVAAYQMVFWCVAVVALAGAGVGFLLREGRGG